MYIRAKKIDFFSRSTTKKTKKKCFSTLSATR